ncbi:MAG: hypothetical protein GY811_11420 [Myxococcales bacterium]|nr:hypothetical protein [Myxococcales bacterium]
MRFLAAATASILLASCEPAPETTSQYFAWQESVSDMQSALLGACSFDGTLYAVGGPYESAALYRWTTRRWLREGTMLEGERLWACWAGPQNRLLAVGQNGTIFRRNAEGWHQDEVPPEMEDADLYGVWGMPDGTAVAVGGGLSSPSETSVILHFDGSTWSRVDTSAINAKTLHNVWASGPEDYWAVGDNGAIAHFDGVEWRPSATRVEDSLYGIHGTGPQDVYAVGGSSRGLVLRWNGSSWLQFDEPSHALRSVWTAPNAPLFVAGYSGYVARYGRTDSVPQADRLTEVAPFAHLRINALVGLGSAIMGAASTMIVDDETGDWRGSVVGHGRSFAGPIFERWRPIPDAPSPPTDAGPQPLDFDAGI